MRVADYEIFGTSHSKYLGCTIKLPKGLSINVDLIKEQLLLRQKGIGRSERQQIEENKLVIESGLSNGVTNGEILKMYVTNADATAKPPITALRPSHADFVGCVKYGLTDARQVAEITSGRNTLPYVLVGSVYRQLLKSKFGIEIFSHTVNIGGIQAEITEEINQSAVNNSVVRCADLIASNKMVEKISQARQNGDTLGGITQIIAYNLPIGYGGTDYLHKLQSVISAYLMAIPSVKGIQFGLGDLFCNLSGSQAVERLNVKSGQISYVTNNNGGTIGGLATGKPLIISLTVKPIPTFDLPYNTVDIVTKQTVPMHVERHDTCVVPNLGIVAENMLAIALYQYQ